MRDPHEPVIPGQHEHPKEGHGGFSMPIGISGDRSDPHEPILPEGMKAAQVAHVEDHPPLVTLDEQLAEVAPESCVEDNAADAEQS